MMSRQLSMLVVGQDILKSDNEVCIFTNANNSQVCVKCLWLLWRCLANGSSIFIFLLNVVLLCAKVGSQCTILTDNYCEDAYDLLQTPLLKKLLVSYMNYAEGGIHYLSPVKRQDFFWVDCLWFPVLQLAGILLDTQNLNASAKLSMTRDAEAVQLLLVGSAPNYKNALFDLRMLFYYLLPSVKKFYLFTHHNLKCSIFWFHVSDTRSKGNFISWSFALQLWETS